MTLFVGYTKKIGFNECMVKETINIATELQKEFSSTPTALFHMPHPAPLLTV